MVHRLTFTVDVVVLDVYICSMPVGAGYQERLGLETLARKVVELTKSFDGLLTLGERWVLPIGDRHAVHCSKASFQ
jgi:hypothetical protein